ncbi:nicotinamide-nucleotide amidase [Methylomarinovum caldicuralii]|uniref:Nicotinamide-nucleotide amidase n=1 Tax=Methylomarinovum caldicuralii TaxID=438856 RepID=A0AAU9C1A1_9GAMM|nr:nicotinamide-nucleotide amidase [Methylomarinovum caldicuralii]BCX80910.1 nicotinamide-nucleotide amidase [Methylomarinovum caldicuralii]
MNLSKLSRQVGERLRGQGLLLTTAESCTGGWIAKCITDVPGSSSWFDRGFVTYSNAAKMEMLGVRAETLGRFGAVSEATVREMAAGALARSRARVAVAVSGIAGPSGGTPDKPVGSVWLAWQMKGQAPVARWYHFDGDREAVRRQAVTAALQGIIGICDRVSPAPD